LSTAAAARRLLLTGTLLAIGSAMLFAAKGVVAKFIYARGMDYGTLVTLRGVLAVPLLWAWGWWQGALEPLGRAPPRALLAAAGAGLLCYCAGSLLDFWALSIIGASLERALLFSYPAMVVMAAAVQARRPPPPSVVFAVLATWVGIVLAVGGWHPEQLAANARGSLAVLTCAACYATYYMVSDRYTREIGSVPFTLSAMTAAGMGLVAWHVARHGGIEVPGDAGTWAWMSLMVVGCTVAPVLMMAEGVRRIGAQRSALVSTAGPPFTVLLSWLALDERLTAAQLAGTLLIVGGILGLDLARARARSRA